MRTAVVFFSTTSRDRILGIAKALAKGIEGQGHQADIIDGDHDVNAKLTIYHYLVIGTQPVSGLGGKIPEKVTQYLSSSGMVSGKRSFAFVSKSTFGAGKSLSRLMRSMEHEGMFIKNSAIISSPAEAEQIGKSLHLK
jgi:menaquinone-dependent protoporphyrinogen IX oxidase